jgi:hypothetical protein
VSLRYLLDLLAALFVIVACFPVSNLLFLLEHD